MERIEHHASFEGWQDVYQHESTVLGCTMKFGIYLPLRPNIKSFRYFTGCLG